MAKIKEYRAVSELSVGALNDKINEMLKDKWIPLAGVSVLVGHIYNESKPDKREDFFLYSQAMVRY